MLSIRSLQTLMGTLPLPLAAVQVFAKTGPIAWLKDRECTNNLASQAHWQNRTKRKLQTLAHSFAQLRALYLEVGN